MKILVCLFLCILFALCVKANDNDEYEIIEEVLKGVDHYKILQVNTDATTQEIKKAFHKLSMIYHPDKIKKENKTPESDQLFLDIARAYQVLSNEKLRETFDEYKTNGVPWEKRYYGRWVHYYGAPSHDVKHVIAVTLVVTTIVHFILKKLRYKRVVDYVKTKEIYKQRAARVKVENNLDESEDVKVEFSGLKEPTWKDLLPVSITIWIWKFSSYWLWYIVCIKILRQPFDREAEMLKQLNMTKEEFEEAKRKYMERAKQFKTSNKAKKARRMMRKYKAGML